MRTLGTIINHIWPDEVYPVPMRCRFCQQVSAKRSGLILKETGGEDRGQRTEDAKVTREEAIKDAKGPGTWITSDTGSLCHRTVSVPLATR